MTGTTIATFLRTLCKKLRPRIRCTRITQFVKVPGFYQQKHYIESPNDIMEYFCVFTQN